MKVKPNGTDAKDIALHFLNETGHKRMTQALVSRTIGQTKGLLIAGYKKDEIISVIDHLIGKGVNMYSIGYVSSAINDTLRELKELETREKAQQVLKEQEKHQAELRGAVEASGEATKRNASKAGRFGTKSRFRKKHNFDMFEGR